jgi:hypothetical protein
MGDVVRGGRRDEVNAMPGLVQSAVPYDTANHFLNLAVIESSSKLG